MRFSRPSDSRLLFGSLFAALFLLGSLGLSTSAHAQHPTAVTSIVNSNADTTMEVNYNGSLLMPGERVGPSAAADSIPAEGAGTRMMWFPSKSAFRAGRVGAFKDGTQWNASKIGVGTAAFGTDTKASGLESVATGRATIATGNRSVALGLEAVASGDEAFSMGTRTKARGHQSVALGYQTRALNEAAVALGFETTAATPHSLTIGEYNSSNTSSDKSLFVVGNGKRFRRADALVLKEDGDLSIDGVFRAGPTGSTFAGHFQGTKNAGDGSLSSYIGYIENLSTGSDADGLAVRAGPSSNPGSSVNYVTFFDGDSTAIGAIEGNGSGGITQVTGGADFAEELPVAEGVPTPEPAALVGVRGGEVRLKTEKADRAMIVSRTPALKGNATPSTTADDDRRVPVAFVGQVPVKLRGPAEIGDLIVPSGKNDGTARAVSPEDYRREKHGPIAGQAWSAKTTEGIGEVTVAVGLGRSGAVAKQFQKQRKRNQKLKEQIADLKAENAAMKRQQQSIEKRLATLETKVSSRSPVLAGLPGTGFLLGLLLGGAVGTGLFFWRPRS